jgi:recombination protein RecT
MRELTQQKLPTISQSDVQLTIVDAVAEQLGRALPAEAISAMRYYLRFAPQLARCTTESLRDAFLAALQLGADLMPERGEAYIIPFNNRKSGITEARLVLGYRYFLRKGYESGLVRLVRAGIVHEGDEYEIELGTQPRLVHRPKFRSSVPVLYYVDVVTASGEHYVQAMGAEEARQLREQRMQNTTAGSPWASEEAWHAMILKTLIRRAYKYLYLPSILQTAIYIDEQEMTAEARQSHIAGAGNDAEA